MRARLSSWQMRALGGAFIAVAVTGVEISQFWLHQGWMFWLWLVLFAGGLTLLASGLNERRRGSGNQVVAAVLALGIFAVIAFPFVVVLVFGSFLERADLLAQPPNLFPPDPTVHWYEVIWDRPNFMKAVRNSLYVATTAALFTTALSILGAYAVARLRFPGRTAIFNLIMFAYMLPGIAILVPMVFLFRQLGLLDTLPGLILAHSALVLPLVTWILIGTFEGFEPELEHAARVDGASRLRVVRSVVVPATIPTVATVAVFAFVISWNELLFSRVLATSNVALLNPQILNLIDPSDRIEPLVSAAGVIASVPVIVLALLMQRFIIREIGAGAVNT